MEKCTWAASEQENMKFIGILEFQKNDGEFENFHIQALDDRLLFGSVCNIGFLESGYILKDGFSNNETLETLLEELQLYYNYGAEHTSMIIYNNRM